MEYSTHCTPNMFTAPLNGGRANLLALGKRDLSSRGEIEREVVHAINRSRFHGERSGPCHK